MQCVERKVFMDLRYAKNVLKRASDDRNLSDELREAITVVLDNEPPVKKKPSNKDNLLLSVIGYPDFILEVRVNDECFSSLDNIPCESGDMVSLVHKDGRYWNYCTSDKVYHDLGNSDACSFTVPAASSGNAELMVSLGMYGEFINLAESSGWVKNVVIHLNDKIH